MTRTFADDFAELRPDEVRRGVHLARLEQVEPGDVFYVLADPSRVLWKQYPDAHEYPYRTLGDELFMSIEAVGDPRARVMVLHNTRGKVPEKLAGDAGGD